MANIKANAKHARTSKDRNLRNRSLKSEIKTAIKIAGTTKDQKDISKAVKLIDSSVTKGVYHKNKAARMKSSLMTMDSTKKAAPKAAPKKVAAKVEAPKVAPKAEVKTTDSADLTKKSVAELKEMAKAAGIKGISKMKKADLVEALS